MKIKLSGDRVIQSIETDEFNIKFNGRSNSEYKAIFAALGITLAFESDKDDAIDMVNLPRKTLAEFERDATGETA